MTNNEIPSWLQNSESYNPPKGKLGFADSTKKSILGLISHFKNNSDTYEAKEANTSLRLFVLLVLVVLTAICKNFSFVIFMLAIVTVRIALLKPAKIKELIKSILPAIVISLIILIPSIFFGNPKTPATVLGKILVCTSLVLIVSLTSPMSDIARSLKIFHIPDIIIFTIQITIKYIMILANICSDMLTALKIRSIGKSKDNKAAMSGIMGSLLIKAKIASEDTAKAMECRGFDGKYQKQKMKKLKGIDIIYLIIFALIIGVFAYLEVIM